MKIKDIYVKLFLILIVFFTITACKRNMFNPPQDSSSTTFPTGYETQLELDNNSLCELYPENGQTGGIGQAGQNCGLRAEIKEYNDHFFVKVILKNFSSRKLITNAKVSININKGENKYKTYNIPITPSKCYAVNLDKSNFTEGKRKGYFHIISQEKNIDFKIGFGVKKVDINTLIVNGQSISSTDVKTLIVKTGDNLIVNTGVSDCKYYHVILSGSAGDYEVMNVYALNGIITIPGNVTSTYIKNSYGFLTIYGHSVYIPRDFTSPIYFDGTKQISCVSIKYGKCGVMKPVIFK